MSRAILLISCPDQRGITAAVAQYIADHNGNIIDAQQHSDTRTNAFFMRIEWSLDNFNLRREEIPNAFQPISGKFNMETSFSFDVSFILFIKLLHTSLSISFLNLTTY